jgi:deoxyribodipyrimidine photo-lyase
MQTSVRVRDNLALALAQRDALDRDLPLEVVFCLNPQEPGVTARSLAYLLDGLEDVARGLSELGLSLTVALGPAAIAIPAAAEKACLVYTDRAYLPGPRLECWEVSQALGCPVILAEDNASVPVREVSEKEEWAAATLRPKLMRLASLEPPLPPPVWEGCHSQPEVLAEDLSQAGVDVLSKPERAQVGQWPVDRSVAPTEDRGGETAAWNRWKTFRDTKLDRYDRDRNDPTLDGQSGLSAALHWGFLSPVSLVEDLKHRGLWQEPTTFRKAGEAPAAKFLDEVLVRRELSLNFVVFNPHHGAWEGLSPWARRTLEAHRRDPRFALYSLAQWEAGATHDAVWNAAQRQLVTTGTIHGYLRMYWGKKLLEWSSDPAQAFLDALYLNNKYALDGHDPNSYAGVAWCFGKHDRPWGERAVYGLVRSMTEGGLRRKFDVDAYVRKFTPPS